MFNFKFSVRYRVSIKFGLGFFEYFLYGRILVLLIFLYSKLRLLFGLGWRGSQNHFVWFSRISKFLVDVGGNLMIVEFGGILG